MLNEFLFYNIISWYLYHFIEYLLHYLSHRRYSGFMYKIHRNHHIIHYPVNKLMDKKPYKTGYYYGLPDGIFAHGPIMISIFIISYNILNTYIFLNLSLRIILLILISDYIHTNIHINGSYLEKYDWFLKLRERHFYHHKNIKKNINIIDNNLDIIFKTS